VAKDRHPVNDAIPPDKRQNRTLRLATYRVARKFLLVWLKAQWRRGFASHPHVRAGEMCVFHTRYRRVVDREI